MPSASHFATTTCMPGHLRAGRVGAVRRLGDQADVALRLAARLRASARIDQQAGVFALRAGVGLQADAGVAGGLAQPGAQLLVEFARSRPAGRRGANGWMLANSGQVIGIISLVAFSFIVHEPSGIMLRSSARSLSDRLRM